MLLLWVGIRKDPLKTSTSATRQVDVITWNITLYTIFKNPFSKFPRIQGQAFMSIELHLRISLYKPGGGLVLPLPPFSPSYSVLQGSFPNGQTHGSYNIYLIFGFKNNGFPPWLSLSFKSFILLFSIFLSVITL